MQDSTPFTLLLRVRYGECDAQQVVFNARYGDYADIAMTEFFCAILGKYQALLDRGLDLQVVKSVTEFLAPARFDDVLAVQVHTAAIGTTSIQFDMRLLRANRGAELSTWPVLTRITTTHVLVSAQHHAKTPVPVDLREQLLRGAPGIVSDQAGPRA